MTSKSVLNINQERLAFSSTLGDTITQWSYIEHALYLIAYRAMGSSDQLGILASGFASIENFRSKLAFVDRAFEASELFAEYAAEWVSLRDEVRSLSSRRNELAHSRVIIYMEAPEGRRIAIVPLFARPAKKQNPRHPPSGSICVRDIDLVRVRFSKAYTRLTSLYFRLGGEEDHFAEHAQQELKPRTLAEIKHQILVMSQPHN